MKGKLAERILYGISLFFVCVIVYKFCNPEEKDNEYSMRVYSMGTKIPVDSFYRKVLGYDTIQLIIRDGKLEANFCYPNKWEFEKWRKDTIYIHDTIYKTKVTTIDKVRDVYIDQR